MVSKGSVARCLVLNERHCLQLHSPISLPTLHAANRNIFHKFTARNTRNQLRYKEIKFHVCKDVHHEVVLERMITMRRIECRDDATQDFRARQVNKAAELTAPPTNTRSGNLLHRTIENAVVEDICALG